MVIWFIMKLVSVHFSLVVILLSCFFLVRKLFSGDLDWDSSRFHVGVASFIAQHGYEIETDRIPGTTTPMLTALGSGDVHVLMEIWKQNVKDAWAKLESEK